MLIRGVGTLAFVFSASPGPQLLTGSDWESYMALGPSCHQLVSSFFCAPFHPIWNHLTLVWRRVRPRTLQDLTSHLN